MPHSGTRTQQGAPACAQPASPRRGPARRRCAAQSTSCQAASCRRSRCVRELACARGTCTPGRWAAGWRLVDKRTPGSCNTHLPKDQISRVSGKWQTLRCGMLQGQSAGPGERSSGNAGLSHLTTSIAHGLTRAGRLVVDGAGVAVDNGLANRVQARHKVAGSHLGQGLVAHARHDEHVGSNVGRVCQLHAELAKLRRDRAHAKGHNVQRAACVFS